MRSRLQTLDHASGRSTFGRQSMAPQQRRALVVRGGWEGHSPQEATDRFIPFLREQGFEVEVSESLDSYLDAESMANTDLVLQLWTMGDITEDQVAGLIGAVRAGTGFAGWHGGIADSFRNSPDYLQLVGGTFATHPGGYIDYSVDVVPEQADHEIVAGLPARWDHHHTEQYWVLACPLNDVLDTTRLEAVFSKGQYSDGYSGFEGTADEETSLADWLRDFLDTLGQDAGPERYASWRATFTTTLRFDRHMGEDGDLLLRGPTGSAVRRGASAPERVLLVLSRHAHRETLLKPLRGAGVVRGQVHNRALTR
jgi:type 1 glutamine amidotransferase